MPDHDRNHRLRARIQREEGAGDDLDRLRSMVAWIRRRKPSGDHVKAVLRRATGDAARKPADEEQPLRIAILETSRAGRDHGLGGDGYPQVGHERLGSRER